MNASGAHECAPYIPCNRRGGINAALGRVNRLKPGTHKCVPYVWVWCNRWGGIYAALGGVNRLKPGAHKYTRDA